MACERRGQHVFLGLMTLFCPFAPAGLCDSFPIYCCASVCLITCSLCGCGVRLRALIKGCRLAVCITHNVLMDVNDIG